MRRTLRQAGGVLKRVATVGVTAALALGMAVSVPVSALAEDAATTGAVTLDKTATPLDENDQTDVTLSIGSTEETTVSDVVFVLDKSASTDIREEAMNMLEELKGRADEGNLVKVGVVNFEQGVLDSLPLTELTDENYATIKEHVIYHEVDSSGTNIHAGLVAGEQMLDADGSVSAANKHLVLVTDGVAYLWGANGTPCSIYSENVSNGEENLYASHETIDWHHADKPYYNEFLDMATWLAKYGSSIASDMATYQIEYESGQYKAKDYGVTPKMGLDTDWSVIPKFAGENSYVAAEDQQNVASAPDAAMYMVATEWSKIAGKYNAYAYEDPRYAKDGKYLWAANAISNLGDLGGYSTTLPESVAEYKGMFDTVKSSVLYEIQSGTVTDFIGSNFDLTSLDSLQMTVGDKTYDGTVSGSTVSFDDGNYTVDYTKADDGTETLTWHINTPVEAANGIKLSYKLTLVNKETAPGSYTVPTNESAKLEYTRHDTNTGTETFPVPQLTYTVAEPEDITIGGDSFRVSKVLENGTLEAGQFEFQLVDEDGNVVSTATNAADGSVKFDDLTYGYDEVGTHHYTISEVLPTDDDAKTDGIQKDGVTYDEHAHKADVVIETVADESGALKLKATVMLPEGGKITFTNTAEKTAAPEPATSTDTTEKPDIKLPSTGDPTSVVAVATTLVAGVGAGAAGFVLRRRNR